MVYHSNRNQKLFAQEDGASKGPRLFFGLEIGRYQAISLSGAMDSVKRQEPGCLKPLQTEVSSAIPLSGNTNISITLEYSGRAS